MRRWILTGIVGGMIGFSAMTAQAVLIDSVVASVGQEPILQSEVMQDAYPRLQAIQQSAGSEEAFKQQADQVLKEALDQAIEHQILYREAKGKVEIPDKEVERRMNMLKKQYPSNEEFTKALESSGTTMSEFRERVKRQIMAVSFGMAKRRIFEEEAVVTESDIAQYYQDHKEEFQHPERARVWRIFIAAQKSKASRKEAKEKLESIRKSLLDGADFAETAKAESEGPEAEESGLVGWVKEGDLVPELMRAVNTLKDGEISAVVETEFGFHLLKVEKREAAGMASFEQARQEIEPLLRKQLGAERYKKWMSTLRQRSDVRVYL